MSHVTQAPHIVTADMGGTSFDVSVIDDGEPARRTRGEMMGVWTALSLVDVESIGAGGGSLGWVDARGMLRVGPRSAGAVPGPACYQRGRDQATVTDALVVLGLHRPDDASWAATSHSTLTPPCGLRAPRGPARPRRRGDGVGYPRACVDRHDQGGAGRLASLGLDPRSTPSSATAAAARSSPPTSPGPSARHACSSPSWPPCSPPSARRPPTCGASACARCSRPCPSTPLLMQQLMAELEAEVRPTWPPTVWPTATRPSSSRPTCGSASRSTNCR